MFHSNIVNITAKRLSHEILLKSLAGVRRNAIGATTLPLLPNGLWLRAFLAVGSSYSVHPIDMIDAVGSTFELTTTRGLMPSMHPAFDWQVDSHRRLLTVPMAVNELERWIRENFPAS